MFLGGTPDQWAVFAGLLMVSGLLALGHLHSRR